MSYSPTWSGYQRPISKLGLWNMFSKSHQDAFSSELFIVVMLTWQKQNGQKTSKKRSLISQFVKAIDWTEQVSIIKILENPSNHPLGGIPPQPKRLEIVVLFLFTSNSPTDLLLSPGLTQNLCCFNEWHFNVADVIPFLQKLVAWHCLLFL